MIGIERPSLVRHCFAWKGTKRVALARSPHRSWSHHIVVSLRGKKKWLKTIFPRGAPWDFVCAHVGARATPLADILTHTAARAAVEWLRSWRGPRRREAPNDPLEGVESKEEEGEDFFLEGSFHSSLRR